MNTKQMNKAQAAGAQVAQHTALECELIEVLKRIYNNSWTRVSNMDAGAGHPDFDALYCISREARAAIAKAEGKL